MPGAVDVALILAHQGFPVFPCGRNKRPAIKDGHGFHDASTDPAEVRWLFEAGGELVGVPTGAITGFDVLDVDYRNSGLEWQIANAHRLPETRIHQTQSGGRHYLFRHAPGVRNNASKVAPGIDVRGDGGYIIAPPSEGYSVISDADVAEWPDWLLELVLSRPEPPRGSNGHHTPAAEISSKRLEAFVRSACDRVRVASDGAKHYALRNAALSVGGVMAAADLSESDATRMLLGALPATVQDWRNASNTIAWALTRGRDRPIELDDRPEYQRSTPGWQNGEARARQDDPGDTANDTPRPGRILTGREFIANHVPPVWLINGIVQRSRLYACTSLTGHGKTAVWLFNACMIHAGRSIGQLDVFKGNVLFLAGENPADLEARMIGLVRAYNLRTEALPYVLPGGFPLNEEEAEALKREIVGLGVPLALIVGDTASSFFPGDDENSNVQVGAYARTLRSFTNCPGRPAVVTLSHPVKNASQGNLLPRGGSAFLNELDGNLTLWSDSPGEMTELHWQGKIRGPDFSPFGYSLHPVPTGLTDETDRPEMTIFAEPISEEAAADRVQQTMANEDVVLRSLRDWPGQSFAQIARDAGWIDDDDQPMKPRVQRAIRALADDKLVFQPRKGARWKLTAKGEEEAKSLNRQ